MGRFARRARVRARRAAPGLALDSAHRNRAVVEREYGLAHFYPPAVFPTPALNTAFSCYLSLLLGFPQSLWRARHLAHHGARALNRL